MHNQQKGMDDSNNPNILHKVVNKLFNKTSHTSLTIHELHEELTEQIVGFPLMRSITYGMISVLSKQKMLFHL